MRVRILPSWGTNKARSERGLPEIPIRYALLEDLPRADDSIVVENEWWTVKEVIHYGAWESAEQGLAAPLPPPDIIGDVAGIAGAIALEGLKQSRNPVRQQKPEPIVKLHARIGQGPEYDDRDDKYHDYCVCGYESSGINEAFTAEAMNLHLRAE